MNSDERKYITDKLNKAVIAINRCRNELWGSLKHKQAVRELTAFKQHVTVLPVLQAELFNDETESRFKEILRKSYLHPIPKTLLDDVEAEIKSYQAKIIQIKE